jgi:hypothetical protein
MFHRKKLQKLEFPDGRTEGELKVSTLFTMDWFMVAQNPPDVADHLACLSRTGSSQMMIDPNGF